MRVRSGVRPNRRLAKNAAATRPSTARPIPKSGEMANVSQRFIAVFPTVWTPRFGIGSAYNSSSGPTEPKLRYLTTFSVTSIFTTSPLTGSVEATVCTDWPSRSVGLSVTLNVRNSGRSGASPASLRPTAVRDSVAV